MGDEQRSSLLAQRRVTRREAEVLDALTERLSNAEIATRLYLSERTVESHVSSLLRKLEAGNRVELGDLAREARADRRPERPSPLPAPLALLADPAHFVGRDPDLAQLRRLWHRAEEGHLLVGLVAGEAGIGKTRLVAELAAQVHAAGNQVLLGSCFQDLRVPYEPFIQAISADIAIQSTAETRRRAAGSANRLAWLMPELGVPGHVSAPDVAVDPASAQAELFAGLHGYLARAADTAPLLVVIEDVQWATTTTLGAIRHLARVSGHAPVLVVVTTRSGPPDLDADLDLFLADLRRLPAVHSVDLAGLSEPDVTALIDLLGGDRDASAVHAATGGNPLLVAEAVGGPASRMGPLRALLTRRYALIDQDDLAVLDLAAVSGPEFDADLLSAAGARPSRPWSTPSSGPSWPVSWPDNPAGLAATRSCTHCSATPATTRSRRAARWSCMARSHARSGSCPTSGGCQRWLATHRTPPVSLTPTMPAGSAATARRWSIGLGVRCASRVTERWPSMTTRPPTAPISGHSCCGPSATPSGLRCSWTWVERCSQGNARVPTYSARPVTFSLASATATGPPKPR